ncbi:alanine/glycine:cation symporter family protein [Clostridium isatidis]|uniref:Sodium:alanine symporter n=1 Tax=Clostridium isatidis TaxID=182773 RepID=A0A343JG36_9CLOT|nr:sodium:alanine symporter family protein [Clostridium isatidis]ASW44494.1 sodium:alanine symporter [Clostridium isatidis]NLZ34100.1 sodium:alanine symporter family protein [Clostridiales bacterium]
MEAAVNKIGAVLLGPPFLILLVGTGIYLTFRLGFIQVFRMPLALKYIFEKEEKESGELVGDVSSFGALCTALSATVGTGNIVGVAAAIKTGGPGALFWMLVAAFFGMATKYAEGLLAIKYREKDENGEMSGGPMYYIEKGLGLRWLAKIFAIFGVGVALLGIGTFGQVKSISEAVKLTFNIPLVVTAAIITIIVALVTLGGIKRIASVSEKIVPFMAILYGIGAIIVLVLNLEKIPEAIKLILLGAFKPKAVLGGSIGITILTAMRSGVSRGLFSNESGLGSAPIAAAAAKTKSPARQGLVSMTGTFIDTMVVCTMTGIVIILTGMYEGNLEGTALTTAAFKAGIPLGNLGVYIVNLGLIFFAFTTIIGWNYYGERCIEYLAGVKAIKPYKIIFIVLVAIGSFLPLGLILGIADIVNGLMAIPNLIGLIGLREVIVSETNIYLEKLKEKKEKTKISLDRYVKEVK